MVTEDEPQNADALEDCKTRNKVGLMETNDENDERRLVLLGIRNVDYCEWTPSKN